MKLKEIFDDIHFTAERQFHVLKHLGEIDENYLALLSKEYAFTPQEYHEIISDPASKFSPAFFRKPEDLIRFFHQHHNDSWTWIDDKAEISVMADLSKFPTGIGHNNLITLADISPEQKTKMHTVNIKGSSFYALAEFPMPTWQVNYIFKKFHDEIFLITIFPGILAPPMPADVAYNEVLQKISLKFWENHVFLTGQK